MSATGLNSKIIRIKLVDGGKVPEYKTAGASCADCYARIATGEVTILAGKRVPIPLGFAIELPSGWEAQIRPRSGLSCREGVDVMLGTIDSDYRGEVIACLCNNSGKDYTVHHGDRVAQLKIQEALQFDFIAVEKLSDTARGDGGFGSTGK